MKYAKETIRNQGAIYAVICGFLLLSTLWLVGRAGVDFSRFFGGLPPVLTVVLVSMIGVFCLFYLRKFGFAVIDPKATVKFYGLTLISGMLFAGTMVALDLSAAFPEDINVAMPEALLFYLLMGMVAEVAFHLIPLLLMLWTLKQLTRVDQNPRVAGVLMLAIALVEPAFQIMAGFSFDPGWLVVAAMGAIIYMFNVLQLWLFRRYDLVTMYLFRIGYYLVWHLIWGHFRLTLLF